MEHTHYEEESFDIEKAREHLQELRTVVEQLDREEEDRRRLGMHPLFGLGEPLLIVRRNLGALIDEARDEALAEEVLRTYGMMNGLLLLLRSTAPQLPEDPESLRRVASYLTAGSQAIRDYQSADTATARETLCLEMEHVVTGIRKRANLLEEYQAMQL